VVGILLDDLHIVGHGILPNDLKLVLRRILLMLGRHANVVSRAQAGAGLVTSMNLPAATVSLAVAFYRLALLQHELY